MAPPAVTVFLASASPRRGELLRQIGVAFALVRAPIDETHDGIETPEDYVLRLARAKAEAGWQEVAALRGGAGAVAGPGVAAARNAGAVGSGEVVAQGAVAAQVGAAVVLGADTAVVLNGQILGKPAGRDDGLRMLARLSGRSHRVLTAVALSDGAGVQSRLSCSEVGFRAIGVAEAERYWESGEPADKAGGYAIQGLGACFIRHLSGSYSAVMGLPLFETAQLLDAAGVPRWTHASAPPARHTAEAGGQVDAPLGQVDAPLGQADASPGQRDRE